eukprot:403373223
MRSASTILISATLLSLLSSQQIQSQDSKNLTQLFEGMQERVSSPDIQNQRRRMWHVHLQSAPLYGNSTELQYFYVNVFVGSQRHPQALIADTGSGIAAMPYESDSKYIYQCNKDTGCSCFNNNKCKFDQSYGEGSSYHGFVVKDKIHFGENYHPNEDAFDFTFGCVVNENNLFFTQDADGILGLTKSTYSHHMKPIFEVMKDAHLIEKKMFTLCLGKNGGYFQIGGYDSTNHMEEVQWAPLMQTAQYRIELDGISMNNHVIDGSTEFGIGFIDSGTTFTYLPSKLWNMLIQHFDWFCRVDKNNCAGARITSNQNGICFKYDEKKFAKGPLPFFMTYPILKFKVKTHDENRTMYFDWFPSEYLYRDKNDQYCIGAEKYSRNEIIIGGTMMRQHNFIFDVEENKVGIARAQCNKDFNQIKSVQEMIESGQKYGLDPNHSESLHQVCSHRGISALNLDGQVILPQETGKVVKTSNNKSGLTVYEYIGMTVTVIVLIAACCCCYQNSPDEDELRMMNKIQGDDSESEIGQESQVDEEEQESLNKKKLRIQKAQEGKSSKNQSTSSKVVSQKLKNKTQKPKEIAIYPQNTRFEDKFENLDDIQPDEQQFQLTTDRKTKKQGRASTKINQNYQNSNNNNSNYYMDFESEESSRSSINSSKNNTPQKQKRKQKLQTQTLKDTSDTRNTYQK